MYQSCLLGLEHAARVANGSRGKRSNRQGSDGGGGVRLPEASPTHIHMYAAAAEPCGTYRGVWAARQLCMQAHLGAGSRRNPAGSHTPTHLAAMARWRWQHDKREWAAARCWGACECWGPGPQRGLAAQMAAAKQGAGEEVAHGPCGTLLWAACALLRPCRAARIIPGPIGGAHGLPRPRSSATQLPGLHRAKVAAFPSQTTPNSPATGPPASPNLDRTRHWLVATPRWPTQSPQQLPPSSPLSSRRPRRQSHRRRRLPLPSSPRLLQHQRHQRRRQQPRPLPPSRLPLRPRRQPLRPHQQRRDQSRACLFVPTWSRRVSARVG